MQVGSATNGVQAFAGGDRQTSAPRSVVSFTDLTKIPGVGFQDEKLEKSLIAFEKAASETPMERCRDEVMKNWKLTDASIAAMPADQASAMLDRVSQEVARRMQIGDPQKSGTGRSSDSGAVPVSSATEVAPATIDLIAQRMIPAVWS